MQLKKRKLVLGTLSLLKIFSKYNIGLNNYSVLIFVMCFQFDPFFLFNLVIIFVNFVQLSHFIIIIKMTNSD